MKIRNTLVLILILSSIGFAQTMDLFNMVNTEYAFAEKAVHSTTKDAFLAFIDDNGIIFKQKPINGKEHFEKSKANNGLLLWYPDKAGISLSGDIGYTTGPASFRADKKDTNDIWFGNFCTVWRKQKNNTWKFLIDFGISNPKPESIRLPYKVEKFNDMIRNDYSELADKSNVKNLEKEFSSITVADVKILNTNNSRLLIDGFQPFNGVEVVKYFEDSFVGKLSYQIIDGEMSSVKDFAYAYGVVTATSKNSNAVEENYYLRIWQKEKTKWQIAIEVWNKKQKE